MTPRKGTGDLLAAGGKSASEILGNGAADFAVHINGLEWTGYGCGESPLTARTIFP
jgi:aldehyde:ferredoxin oxidoreductase